MKSLARKDGTSIGVCNIPPEGIINARRTGSGDVAAKRKERIYRELGNKEGLAISLVNQARLLAREMGRPHEVLPLAKEAHRLATNHGLVTLAQQIKPILDQMRSQAR